MTYPRIQTAIFIFILSAASAFMPWLKLYFLAIALFFFGILFGRRFLFTIIAAIALITAVSTHLVSFSPMQELLFSFVPRNADPNKNASSVHQLVPDAQSLFINVDNVTLEFDPSRIDIVIPSDLTIKQENKTLSILGSSHETTIIVGMQKIYKEIIVQTSNISITGMMNGETKKISISGSNIKMSADIAAKEIEVNGINVTIDNTLRSSFFTVDSNSLLLKGHITANTIALKGGMVKSAAKVTNADNIYINSMHTAGSITYTDTWIEERSLTVKDLHSTLYVKIPRENRGTLSVKGEQGITVESY